MVYVSLWNCFFSRIVDPYHIRFKRDKPLIPPPSDRRCGKAVRLLCEEGCDKDSLTQPMANLQTLGDYIFDRKNKV